MLGVAALLMPLLWGTVTAGVLLAWFGANVAVTLGYIVLH